jgi:hypothetical protein
LVTGKLDVRAAAEIDAVPSDGISKEKPQSVTMREKKVMQA